MLNFIGWALLLWCLWTMERVGINGTTLALAALGVCLLLLSYAVKVGTSAILLRQLRKAASRGR